MSLLFIKDLYCGYDEQFVLKGITFGVKANEFVGIIGPNGSGKTTILRAINRILDIRQGQILIDEQDIETLPRREIAKLVATVPQLSEPVEGFTTAEMVLLGRTPWLRRFMGENEKDYEMVKWAMEEAKVSDFGNRPVTTLSGGEFQRVIIARALAQEPKILLLDEPTAHLDIKYQVEILNLLKNLRDSRGIVATFHDLNLAAAFCDRLILLSQGSIVADGLPEEVLTKENVKKVYGVDVHIERRPRTEKIIIISVR